MNPKRLAKIKEWQKDNPDKVAEYHRRWLKKNPEKAEEIKERARIRSREYYRKNKPQCLKRMAEWSLRNTGKVSEYQSAYRKSYVKRPGASRRRSAWLLKRAYGLSMEQFDSMIVKQNGKCGICGIELRKPYVDHDHGSGKVRGILCVRCNVFLGLYDDRPWIINGLKDYLANANRWESELLG